MIRKNMKLIIGIILGIISVGGVYAVNSLNAGSITIDNSNMPKITGEKLNNALDYLYTKANTTNMITIESGVKHLSQTYLGIAYLDPTDLTKKCSSEDAKANRNQDGTITGVKTGCMKWYIYDEDSTSYKAILDHNTTASVAYNSDNINISQKEIAEALLTDTTGWASSLNPRLITANEVAKIAGADIQINWNSNTATRFNWFFLDSKNSSAVASGQGTSNYGWLFDNLGWNDQFGNSTTRGGNEWDRVNSAAYWTDSPVTGDRAYVWIVGRDGRLGTEYANVTVIGLRPVITISKS